MKIVIQKGEQGGESDQNKIIGLKKLKTKFKSGKSILNKERPKSQYFEFTYCLQRYHVKQIVTKGPIKIKTSIQEENTSKLRNTS